MTPKQAMERYQKYLKASKITIGTRYQRNLDTLTLAILGGDMEKLEQYRAVAHDMNHGHYDLTALGTLIMALMEKTCGKEGLIATMLGPAKKERK